MSERLPYEEQLSQQWDDLTLPDENRAWEDMKQRLEEEDDDKIVFWWRRGCMLWGFLLLGLLGLGWWLLQPQQWFKGKNEKEETTATISSAEQNKQTINRNDTAPFPNRNKEEQPVESSNNITGQIIADSSVSAVPVQPQVKKNATGSSTRKTLTDEAGMNTEIQQPAVKKRTVPVKTKNNVSRVKQQNDQPANIPGLPTKDITNKPAAEPVKDKPVIQKTKTPTSKAEAGKKDSLKKEEKTTDTLTVKNAVPKTDSAKKKAIFFSAGLGLHQQLPVAGQKLTPYNASGRKASLADYIPSVYFRMTKKDKWFLQAEFRYGAPQTTKAFVYDQQVVTDTFPQQPSVTTTTSSKLKKTFYHQLPLTFNYYIKPGWSIGAGIQVNKFSAAVSEREVRSRISGTIIDSVISKGLVSTKGDSITASAFKKTYMLGVIETQYQHKRFSFGARYSFGLEPYIKFTLPGGTAQQERSHSVQVFLRYQLWKSKEK
jgi:hypothetical protein